jgi:hypothetical protein
MKRGRNILEKVIDSADAIAYGSGVPTHVLEHPAASSAPKLSLGRRITCWKRFVRAA